MTNFFTVEEMNEKMDEAIAMNVVYLDSAKVFDKVPHIQLGENMEASRFRGNLLRWIEN